MTRAAWIAAVILVPSAAAPARPPDTGTLEPVWQFSCDDAPEWVHTLDACGGVLVGTRSGAVWLLDRASGRPLWDAPVEARPGVRPAEREADLAAPIRACEASGARLIAPLVVFDRYRIYALHPGDAREPLVWRHGFAPEPGVVYHGEPDDLDGWIAVSATADGVLAVSRRGRLTVLDGATGDVRNGEPLAPAIASARFYHGHGSHALVWRHAGAAFCTWLRTAGDPAVGEALPLRGTVLDGVLTADALLALYADGAVFEHLRAVHDGGAQERQLAAAAPGERRILHRGVNASQPEAQPLLVMLSDRALRQQTLSGEEATTQASMPLPPPDELPTAAAHGNAVIARTRAAAALWDTAAARFAAAVQVPSVLELIEAGVIEHAAGRADSPRLAVVAATRHACSEPHAYYLFVSTSAQECTPPAIALTGCADVRRFHFCGGWLLAVEAQRILAYKLPDCSAR